MMHYLFILHRRVQSSFTMISTFFFAILMLCCYSTPSQSYSTAYISTTWTIDISDDEFILFRETDKFILFRETDVAEFLCGFSCVENSTSCLFSVSISGARANEQGYDSKVVWSANRNYPVRENATLNFTSAGELFLQDVDGSIVWTTNTAGKSVAGMNLTDTGNLVLFDDRKSVVWQSFDHPTDCWLPGQDLYTGQKLISDVSLTNSSEGMYSLQVRDNGLIAYVESNPPQVYNSWSLEGLTGKGRRHIRFLNGSLSLFFHSFPDGLSLIYIPRTLSAHYIKLMPDGHLQLFHWQSDSKEWTIVAYLTRSDVGDCGNYPLVCGKNSICSSNQQCSCPAIEYFRAVNDRQLNLGCSEITPLTCSSSTQDQSFITLENVTYFSFTVDMEEVNMETCKQSCLNNCSCKAAFFKYDSNASSGDCSLQSELLTMTNGDSDYGDRYLAFLKVQNVKSHRWSHKVARVVGSSIGGFVLLCTVAIGCIMHTAHKHKRDADMDEDYLDQLPGMPTRFSYDELKTATENFSKKLGEGGFGSVFEGTLGDGTRIAVKCLEGLSHIKKSFLAEVQSIGSIHHVNLVRLRGFCAWKSQRLLVYDFMSNGSLDRWIYHGVRDHILEWECRKKIILDIAKGLAYLHEDCRQRIIHLDIKPQNILLDNDFNAKLSDFGLSRLIDKSQTEVMTTIKGTPGYIAPECWNSIITEKADVYSFGIVLLEILCGRKIFERSEPEERWHLLFVFQKCWEQGSLLDMVDKHNEDMQVQNTEVVEMMKMASWCLQIDYTRRPSMSSVVKVLEGGMSVESNLDYNFTDPRLQKNNSHEKDLTPLPPSILSGPR